MSYLNYFKLLLQGYIVYKNPSNQNTSELFDTIVETFLPDDNSVYNSDDVNSNNSPSQNSHSLDIDNYFSPDDVPVFVTPSFKLIDTSKDIPCKEDDSTELVCKICATNLKNIVLLPCSHSSTCSECTNKLLSSTNKCPICRQDIQNTIFYFSS